ncbi:D-alanyl-D-alanine carboxypeptidase family protein [Pseudoneobacillus rhizosphaerae]|uniref:serine-type D-Ala-D-Ala carboxypeptidase n=1 Tax=Pseudoneobacillus rhizosphaerae TaxID=2880968 RepID=A0A9C7G9B6_9BACI|nr:D-alanyl-D-alanine carboxypeptidase family protein [Pseudoneobacillus rhizosphaerae]CAG9608359.1 D-alanyl-D-alanine carboxypeptidase DacB [Pseudoneobacillus rhizosphaerae]
MKRFVRLCTIFLAVSLIFVNFPQMTAATVSVSASSAVLMDQESGRVLFGKDAHEKKRIASITKIMTAILAIESGKLEKMVQVSAKATRAEGSSVYLKPNEKIKLEDLVYGLMLRSGNDTAEAIAEYVGGSLDGFVFLMNQKAKEIGMANTNFGNPHGLDNFEDHYSTAYDMALLTRYAMQNETYRVISGTKIHKAPNPEEKWDRVWRNKNRLLSKYKYTTGGKTGYTKRAKRTLVTTATKGDMDLISVTLNAPDDWNDHISMFEYGFQNYDLVEVISKGKIDKVKDKSYQNHIFFKRSFTYPVKEEEKELISVKYKLIKPTKEWLKTNPEVVGKAIVYLDNRPIEDVSIFFKQELKEEKKFTEYFKSIFLSILSAGKTNG